MNSILLSIILVPVVEIYLLIKIGSKIGAKIGFKVGSKKIKQSSTVRDAYKRYLMRI